MLIAVLFLGDLPRAFSEPVPDDEQLSAVRKGDNFFNRSDYHRASLFYQKAVNHSPVYLPARIGLAASTFAEGRFREAAATLEEAIELSPGNTELYFQLLETVAAAENNSGLIEEFRQIYLDRKSVV